MTGPDRIWICRHGGKWSNTDGGTQDTEYTRRDPAVLAALPEVQALIRQAVAQAFETAAREIDCGGCYGNCADPVNCHADYANNIRALTPDAAAAARDASRIALYEEERKHDAAKVEIERLKNVIADIREATVGSNPMLSELAQALVAWRDDAVEAEREACANEALNQSHCGYPDEDGVWWDHDTAQVGREIADAIRKRVEG